ncbi:hypothetical protein FD49_GL001089 [Latilactobacillus sakei subsp. sakei DSM 20017 = JCM 1157]|uniref:hypothetical protein n=1 Tax=Latilactobacillus sakei TaxID=1599 RepID=UPI0004688752|nr:hypothetical protein [Latilactobacillus sakei]AWZ46853.1 hypothetical protein CXB69_07795 [Latilactobacillus sakei]KRK71643.1 hypothetical protein FD49_GL001089 [Latilactobacillus sakei subsp. sakei DSM 20017 = JCM 1157]MCB4409367.1 hypothetical protein [Latilactobacillus sakei]MDG9752874.1 hypothetical protein [Latilactobacillus sakei]MDM5043660.1 hypothetical protein [Latilactobacillus sakei]
MRVIDLLQLLADTPRNALIFFEGSDQNWPIADFEQDIHNEQPRLLLQTVAKKPHPLKQWEFSLLLNHREYYQHYVYVNQDNQAYPLFGFRVAQNKILLG